MAKAFLAVFDFDYTLAKENSIVTLEKLLPTGESGIEQTLLTSVTVDPVDFYSDLFGKLYAIGYTIEDIREALKSLKISPGLELVLEYLSEHNCEAIVTSDSITMIVNEWLKVHDLEKYFQNVYVLPSRYREDGSFEVKPYHQHSCTISYRTLCKGDVLENHVKKRKQEGVTFSRIGYFGDSYNDICPILRLSDTDLAFPRKDFVLSKMFKESNDDILKKVKASVYDWSSGEDVLNVLKNIF